MAILIVDDEELALSSLARIIKWQGYTDVETCDNGTEAIDKIKANDYDIVLLDLLLKDKHGLDVLKEAKPYKPGTEFIVITAVDDVDTAMGATRLGAYDYLVKPPKNERLLLTIQRAYERRGLQVLGNPQSRMVSNQLLSPAFSQIVTGNPKMLELLKYTQVMARSGNAILLTGSSGTGKELLAQAIHKAGQKPDGPFVAVNVAAITETMFESQFFGHVKGAFTGASMDHAGFFEQANGGTIFLDEVGEISPQQQIKFLRVLEEKKVTRIGGTGSFPLDIRIVSATNADLDEACRQGSFRLDLLYRLKSAHVHLPALRERGRDIVLLAQHFFDQAKKRHNKDIEGISPEAMEMLQYRDYPGNIRELAQVVENGVLLCDRNYLLPSHLKGAPGLEQEENRPSLGQRTLCSFREDYKQHLAFVLEQTGGDRGKAAEILGVSLRQIHRKLAELKGDPLFRDRFGNI